MIFFGGGCDQNAYDDSACHSSEPDDDQVTPFLLPGDHLEPPPPPDTYQVLPACRPGPRAARARGPDQT